LATKASFAAWKTVAWHRGASRDLFDLWSLARIHAIDADAVALFAQHGPTNKPPASHMLFRAPTSKPGAASCPTRPVTR
jgi:Nucleotidyl transferase AbiEii toxin, Type IV TA system